MNAREFIGTKCEGPELCCSCGLNRATKLISKSVKTTFTDFTALIKNPSQYICDSCLNLYNDKNMRFKPIYSDAKGTYRIIDRSEVLDIIRNPADEFVLSLPYSFKKHHWLYAGVSNKDVAKIGTDDRTVIVDYRKTDINQLIDNIADLLQYGVPRSEIISGKYSIFTLSKFPFVKNVDDEILKDVRQSGLVELIVKYTPAVKNKKIYESEEETMLTEAEKNAVNLLGAIASGSEYRIQNGLQFWSDYFERRINRFKRLDPNEFVSKLAESVGTSNTCGYHDMVTALSDDQLSDIMDVIRKETHLLVSIVYSERKKD
jgi:hypothetical protein